MVVHHYSSLQGPQNIFGGPHAARRPQFGLACSIRICFAFGTRKVNKFELRYNELSRAMEICSLLAVTSL